MIGVTAVDQDIGNNGKVVYSLEGPDKSYFNISSDMGVVTNAKPLGQDKRKLNFVVRASDQVRVSTYQHVNINCLFIALK